MEKKHSFMELFVSSLVIIQEERKEREWYHWKLSLEESTTTDQMGSFQWEGKENWNNELKGNLQSLLL